MQIFSTSGDGSEVVLIFLHLIQRFKKSFIWSGKRLLILAPNKKQGKCYFYVLVCCTGSTVYLACKENSKVRLELKILCSEAHF